MVWGKIDNPEEEPKYTDDDGLFDKGERAQKHYDEMFSPKEAAQKKAAEGLTVYDGARDAAVDIEVAGHDGVLPLVALSP